MFHWTFPSSIKVALESLCHLLVVSPSLFSFFLFFFLSPCASLFQCFSNAHRHMSSCLSSCLPSLSILSLLLPFCKHSPPKLLSSALWEAPSFFTFLVSSRYESNHNQTPQYISLSFLRYFLLLPPRFLLLLLGPTKHTTLSTSVHSR